MTAEDDMCKSYPMHSSFYSFALYIACSGPSLVFRGCLLCYYERLTDTWSYPVADMKGPKHLTVVIKLGRFHLDGV